jgi:hypothetical protein
MDTLATLPTPNHWDLLSESDKEIYLRIAAALSAPALHSKGNKCADNFKEILDAIEVFENSNESDKWKRCLVCGVRKIQDGIVVNLTQLKKLVLKCKSSINRSLHSLGYQIVMFKRSTCTDLLDDLFEHHASPADLRQWTVRMKPFVPLPVNAPMSPSSPPAPQESTSDQPPSPLAPEESSSDQTQSPLESQSDTEEDCPWKEQTMDLFEQRPDEDGRAFW